MAIPIHLIRRQAMRGNFKPLTLFLRRCWRGVMAGRTCVQCGKAKERNFQPRCASCQLHNIQEALFGAAGAGRGR